jgi:hypothetical protein
VLYDLGFCAHLHRGVCVPASPTRFLHSHFLFWASLIAQGLYFYGSSLEDCHPLSEVQLAHLYVHDLSCVYIVTHRITMEYSLRIVLLGDFDVVQTFYINLDGIALTHMGYMGSVCVCEFRA